MTFVPTRTDSSKHAAVDGVDTAFGATLEATAGGFGVKNTVKGIDTFEVLDALPLNRSSVQTAVEAGSSSAAAAQAGITAVDFSVNVDYIDETEVDASAALDSEVITSALV